MRTQKQDADHADPWLWQLLQPQQAFDSCRDAAFFCDFPEYGRAWGFAVLQAAPGDCPLTLQRMALALAYEEDAVLLANNGTDAYLGLIHRKCGSQSVLEVAKWSAAAVFRIN